MKELRYNLIFRPEPEGGFTVIAPAFPGLVTYGKNIAEARRMALDAIEGYIASLRKHREHIPSDEDTLIASVKVRRGERASSYA